MVRAIKSGHGHEGAHGHGARPSPAPPPELHRTGSAAAMRKYGTWICRRGCGSEFQAGVGWLKRAATEKQLQ